MIQTSRYLTAYDKLRSGGMNRCKLAANNDDTDVVRLDLCNLSVISWCPLDQQLRLVVLL